MDVLTLICEMGRICPEGGSVAIIHHAGNPALELNWRFLDKQKNPQSVSIAFDFASLRHDDSLRAMLLTGVAEAAEKITEILERPSPPPQSENEP